MTTPLLHILLSFYFVAHILSNVSTMYSGKAAVRFIWSCVGNNFRWNIRWYVREWGTSRLRWLDQLEKNFKTLFNLGTFLRSDRCMYLAHNMYFSSTRGLSIRTKQKTMIDDVAQDHGRYRWKFIVSYSGGNVHIRNGECSTVNKASMIPRYVKCLLYVLILPINTGLLLVL